MLIMPMMIFRLLGLVICLLVQVLSNSYLNLYMLSYSCVYVKTNFDT
jgi:hypothetical protein